MFKNYFIFHFTVSGGDNLQHSRFKQQFIKAVLRKTKVLKYNYFYLKIPIFKYINFFSKPLKHFFHHFLLQIYFATQQVKYKCTKKTKSTK